MFIYDVLNKEKVYQIVSSDLRNLGVKRRVKKQTSAKPHATDKHESKNPAAPQNLKKVFKTPLSQLPLDVVKLSSGAIIHVPNFLTQACACIEKCVTHEGLFRKAGSHLRQKEIISRLDSGASLGEKYQVVDVANVLKTFFRELPEPLIPTCYHDVFLRCALLKNNTKIDALLLACILLPPHHLNTLAFFAEFLKRVARHEKMNKMGVDNLAKVVGPNLMPIQETTMSAIQSRLETQLVIVKILIENAERIGVLPEHVADFVVAETSGSVETELDASDSALRSKNKKKKRRSGSLTRKTHLSASNLNLRMLNGLKKMVSKGGSPDEGSSANSRVVSVDFNPAHTPSIKTGKKRKVVEPAAPLSTKKKREVLQNMPDGGFTRQGNLASIVSNDPNPCKEKSPVQKSRVKKYLSQKIHNDFTSSEKLEKTKKIRLSLDRLVSKSKQKIAELDSNSQDKSSNSPKIERRWSSVSGSSWSKKKRGVYEAARIQSPLRSKNKVLDEVYDRDEVFMEADVNLSDENDAGEDQMSEELMEVDGKSVSENGKHESNFSRRYEAGLSPYDFLTQLKTKDPGTKFLDINTNADQGDEEYVTIPKSEYEEIKNRVSAIESRISQEFGCISTNASQSMPQSSASKVQSEYEKTLEEASIGSTTTADHLAKRLGKELKIRRSAEHKIIRSPSARKIGNLRRRSQERPVGKRSSARHVSWLISKQEQLNNSGQKSALKRGRPNTVFTGLTQPSSQAASISDTICSDETNARLDFLQKQLHALITHTVEHTKGSLSDEEVFASDRDEEMEGSENLGRAGIRRASSFHGSEFVDNSRHFNSKIRELKKSNSQQNVSLNSERTSDPGIGSGEKSVKWKDADCYFSSDHGTRTPAPQTGRASVAKLRAQNAGMVLAKAKLFDDGDRGSGRRQSAKLGRSREVKSLDLDNSSSKKGGTQRRKHSKSPKNGNAKLKLVHSASASSPLIKMELTIMPSQQQNVQQAAAESKRGARHGERQRMEYFGKGEVKSERSYKENKNSGVFDYLDKSRSPESNLMSLEPNTPCKTPHIKRPLTLKTPKDAKNLIRKQGADSRRTPMKAVALNSAQLNTPRRQSPRSALKSRQLTRSVS